MAIQINGATVIDDSQNWTGTAVAVAKGGTGLSSLLANNLVVGNGTSSVLMIAPGAIGNTLVSNGTSWVSQSSVISGSDSYKFFSAF